MKGGARCHPQVHVVAVGQAIWDLNFNTREAQR